MRFLALLQIFLLVACTTCKIAFFGDVLKEKTQPILMGVCWKKRDVVDFFRVITKKIAFITGGDDLFKLHSFFAVVDLTNCTKSKWIFNEVNHHHYFHLHSWLILINANEYKNFATLVEKLPISPSTEIILGLFQNDQIKLVQPYKTTNKSNLVWEDYGFWHKNTGLTVNYSQKTPCIRRHNLGQTTLKILVEITNNDTIKNLENFKNPKIDANTKQDWGSIKPLLDYCNVTYELIKFGGGDEQFDLIGSSVMITESNFERYDFIKMIHPRQIKFFLKKPPVSYVTNVFVIVFDNKVWLSVIAILAIFASTLYVILNVEGKHQKYSLGDVTMILFEAFCKQGTTTDPKSISGRISIYLLFLAFMFLSIAYSANIVVLLQSTKSAKNVEELFAFGIEVGDTSDGYFRNYSEKFQLNKNESYYDVHFGLDRVRMGFFAFRTEKHEAHRYILEKFHDYDICGLQEITNSKNEFNGYVAIPKGSPYKEIFKIGLLKVHESGLQKRSIRRFHSIPKCFNKAVNFNNAGITDCYLAIMVMVVGTILSVIVLKVEQTVCKVNIKNNVKSL